MWSNLINFVAAVGTCAAVFVALWGARLVKPKLQLDLNDEAGAYQKVSAGVGPAATELHARYFHIRVNNKHRHPTAHHVRVVLLRLEEFVNGTFVDRGGGGAGIPLTWQHEAYTGTERTVGPAAYADFFHVVGHPQQAAMLQTSLAVLPVGMPNVWQARCKLRFTLQAQSDEAESTPLRFTVDWDGRFSTEGIAVQTDSPPK